MDGDGFVSLEWKEKPIEEMFERARTIYQENQKRRTTRHFSNQHVPRELVELAIQSGGTAPNGAHLQPWTWVAISNTALKQSIRNAAEEEERKTYAHRMPEAWAEVLAPLGTDAVKSHLTDAPWIVVLFKQKNACGTTESGGQRITLQSLVGLLQACSSMPFIAWG